MFFSSCNRNLQKQTYNKHKKINYTNSKSPGQSQKKMKHKQNFMIPKFNLNQRLKQMKVNSSRIGNTKHKKVPKFKINKMSKQDYKNIYSVSKDKPKRINHTRMLIRIKPLLQKKNLESSAKASFKANEFNKIQYDIFKKDINFQNLNELFRKKNSKFKSKMKLNLNPIYKINYINTIHSGKSKGVKPCISTSNFYAGKNKKNYSPKHGMGLERSDDMFNSTRLKKFPLKSNFLIAPLPSKI